MKIRALLLSLAALVMVVVTSAVAIVFTQPGTRWLVERIAGNPDLGIAFVGVSGTLWSGLSAGEFRYRSKVLAVTVTQATLRIEPKDLLLPRLNIIELSAAKVSVTDDDAGTEADSSGFALPDLPIAIRIQALKVDTLSLMAFGIDESAADIRIEGDMAGIQVDLRQLSFMTHDISINAGAKLQLSDDFPIEVELQWDAPQFGVSGQGTVTGNMDELAIEHRVFTPEVVRINAKFVNLTDEFMYTATATADRILVPTDGEPVQLSDLSARMTGDLKTIRMDSLGGRINDYRIVGSAIIVRDAGQVTINEAQLLLGDNRLSFSGTVSPSIDGRFALSAVDLSQLLPELTGKLEARGSFAGTPLQPIVDVRGHGSRLRIAARGLSDIEFSANITQSGKIVANLTAMGITAGDRLLGDASLEVHGTLVDHELSLALTDGPIRASLASKGHYANKLLQQTISQARIDLVGFGAWQLRAPAAVRYRLDNRNFRISPHCWAQQSSLACLDQTIWTGKAFTTAATLAEFPMSQFDTLLPEYIKLDGFVNAELQMSRTSSGFRGTGSIHQENLLVSYTTEQNDVVETLVESMLINADGNDDTATISLSATADYNSEASGELNIDTPFNGVKPVSGRFSGRVPDLSKIAPLVELATGLKDATGELVAQAEIFGTTRAPRISGGVELTNGSVFVPATSITLRDVHLSILGTENGQATVEGIAHSGDGQVNLLGSLSFAERSARLRITGENFETLRMPDKLAVASPSIDLGYAQNRIDIGGTLRIPEANFAVHKLPETAVIPSVDAIDHDAEQSEAGRRQPLVNGAITVVLGDQVQFSGFGLTTGITGRLGLRQDTRRRLFADGILKLKNGRFDAYGQKLKIERGTLIFSGPIDDPKVDVKASRSVQYEGTSVKAGVLLTGTASNISTRVFSEPVMSEANALSYLVIGRPIEKAGSSDSAALTNAAITMGLRQALPIVAELGETVGLDEVGIGGDATDETSFLAGTQLNDDLSVRYTYGLFSRIGTFIARYSLGRGFNIEASSGENQSLELIYTVDR